MMKEFGVMTMAIGNALCPVISSRTRKKLRSRGVKLVISFEDDIVSASQVLQHDASLRLVCLCFADKCDLVQTARDCQILATFMAAHQNAPALFADVAALKGWTFLLTSFRTQKVPIRSGDFNETILSLVPEPAGVR